MALPDPSSKPDGTPKRLLVESLGGLLPDSIVHRPKQGFTLPFDPWMRGPLRSFCEERLGDRGLSGRGLFQAGADPAALAVVSGRRPTCRGRGSGFSWSLTRGSTNTSWLCMTTSPSQLATRDARDVSGAGGCRPHVQRGTESRRHASRALPAGPRELFIVDSGSTDSTVAIARQFGAKSPRIRSRATRSSGSGRWRRCPFDAPVGPGARRGSIADAGAERRHLTEADRVGRWRRTRGGVSSTVGRFFVAAGFATAATTRSTC